jgi:hypothetical protein
MGGINHRIGRSRQWFESRQRQPSKAGGIILERGAVRRSDRSGDLLDNLSSRR